MLPAVAALGLQTPDVLLTCLAAALIPLVLVQLLDRERGTASGRGREHLWLAVAWTFAGPACLLGANGRVWFTAQVFGALALVLYLSAAWNARRPAWTGLWLGLAVACRPINMLPAIVVFALEWRREGRRPAAALRFLAPLLVIGGLLAWHNFVRFGSPFEFGHRFLEIRWQAACRSSACSRSSTCRGTSGAWFGSRRRCSPRRRTCGSRSTAWRCG